MTSDQVNDDNIDNEITFGVADTVELSTDFRSGPQPSECVVDAISKATGVDPLSLPPLHGAVDPEALDAIVESTSDASVSFDYESLRIEVNGDGDIAVSDR